jgi:hypothetical protein
VARPGLSSAPTAAGPPKISLVAAAGLGTSRRRLPLALAPLTRPGDEWISFELGPRTRVRAIVKSSTYALELMVVSRELCALLDGLGVEIGRSWAAPM